jgi:hypothetical protein
MPTAPFPAFTAPYKTIEAALVRMHDIALEDVGAFRSRLGALQKGGLLGAENQPGKGQKLDYGIDQFRRLVLAIELTQAGLGPGVVLRLVKDGWKKLNGIFNRAEEANSHPAPGHTNDVVLTLLVDLMFAETGPAINYTTRDKLREQIELVFDEEEKPARLLLVNLSLAMRKFHAALVHFHLQPDRLVEAALAPQTKPRKRR